MAIKKINPLILIIIFFSVFITGCAAVIENSYSIPTARNKFNGYLLRGDGWTDWKYNIAIDNVYQIENDDYLIAAKVNNENESFLATGIWIVPFIPLFGIPGGGYKGEVSEGIPGVNITIAIFMKNNAKFTIDPCKIKIKKSDQSLLSAVSYKYSFINNKALCNCDKPDNKPIMINEKFYDILEIEVTYKEALYPQNNIDIIFPEISYNNKKIQVPSFKFNKGIGFIWTSIL